MRIIFSLLSIAYIGGIFLFADSSVVSDLSTYNPYSLLHIPLYAILTALLIFSFLPRLPRSESVRGQMRSLFHWGRSRINSSAHYRINAFTHPRFLIVGLIALAVGIADEIHQAYVPGRDASFTDVLLDLVGIIIVLLFIRLLLIAKTAKATPR